MKSNIVGSLDKSFKLDKPNILKHVYLISYFPPKNSHGFLNSSFLQKGANFFSMVKKFFVGILVFNQNHLDLKHFLRGPYLTVAHILNLKNKRMHTSKRASVNKLKIIKIRRKKPGWMGRKWKPLLPFFWLNSHPSKYSWALSGVLFRL